MPPALANAINHTVQNWKSTASGALTLITLTGGFFTAIPSATLQQHGVTQNEIFWGTCIVGLAKLYVDWLRKDAQ